MIRTLPNEVGCLFQLQNLGLSGNPLIPELSKLYNEPNGTHRVLMHLLNLLEGKRFIIVIYYTYFCISKIVAVRIIYT